MHHRLTTTQNNIKKILFRFICSQLVQNVCILRYSYFSSQFSFIITTSKGINFLCMFWYYYFIFHLNRKCTCLFLVFIKWNDIIRAIRYSNDSNVIERKRALINFAYKIWKLLNIFAQVFNLFHFYCLDPEKWILMSFHLLVKWYLGRYNILWDYINFLSICLVLSFAIDILRSDFCY